jgi:hypothetical protein
VERRGSDLAAVSRALLALQPSDAPAYLQRQVPELFSSHPDGSLWFVDVDPLLSKRLSLLPHTSRFRSASRLRGRTVCLSRHRGRRVSLSSVLWWSAGLVSEDQPVWRSGRGTTMPPGWCVLFGTRRMA